MLRVVHASPLGDVIRLWDAVQVELHGRYSLSRLYALKHHKLSSSRLRNVTTVLLAPLPCLVVVTAMDALPVNPSRMGFWKQTPWIVFRVAFAGWIMAYMIAMQVHHSSPTLPLSTARLWIISLSAAITCALVYSLLGIFVAFPTPFVTQLLTPPWFTTLTLGLYLSWRHALRRDAIARENLRCYSVVFVAQVAIILVYTAYNIAFTTVGSEYQTYVALCLPTMKLFFKNAVNRGIYHMEDLAPTVIVFNVDVFHALFVSSTMQQAKTGDSVIVVMAVDVIQAVIALVEVQNVLVRIRRNVARIAAMEKMRTSSNLDTPTQTERLRDLGLIEYALDILETRRSVREHPHLTQPRHLRLPTRRRMTIMSQSQPAATRTVVPTTSVVNFTLGPPVTALPLLGATSTVVPATATLFTAQGPPVTSLPARSAATQSIKQSTASSKHLADIDQLRLRIVQDVLQLLHMVEFYVLIEFAEVVIAAVYTLYMLALSVLPTRAYYKPLAVLSHDQLKTTIRQVAQYTALELLSFAAFCLLVDRLLRWRVSAIQQLAFALQTHARIVQTTLVMWVFFVAQLTFDHLGTDYTFKFAWLHESRGGR